MVEFVDRGAIEMWGYLSGKLSGVDLAGSDRDLGWGFRRDQEQRWEDVGGVENKEGGRVLCIMWLPVPL